MLIYEYSKMQPRSQKAKGLQALKHRIDSLGELPLQSGFYPFVLMQEPINLLNDEETATAVRVLQRLFGHALFVRPCPATPRHGFVESRKVDIIPTETAACPFQQAITQFNSILAEAQAVDPDAELVIMNYIDASYSAVLTGESLSIGTGNDGATSGRDAISLPTAPVEVSDELKKIAGIENSAFMEFVIHGFSGSREAWIMTQLRDGPVISNRRWFIPVKMKVKRVQLIPAVSLTVWEEMCKELAKEKGVIVYHPGGTLASHWAIHCQLNNIAISCAEDAPKIGLTYETTETGERLAAPDATLLMDAMAEAACWDRKILHQVYALPLYILHNYSAFDLSNPVHVRLLGWGLMLAVKLGVAALWGERRYGAEAHLHPNGMLHEVVYRTSAGGNGKRTVRYNQVLRAAKLESIIHMVAEQSVGFGYEGWSSDLFTTSIGGLKWLACADATFMLWNRIVDCIHGYCPFNEVMIELNRVINVSHNGSKLLTKLIPAHYFELAPKQPYLMTKILAVRLYDRLRDRAKFRKLKKVVLEFRPTIIPGEKLRRPDLRKAYSSVLASNGNNLLASALFWLPERRTGDDWTDHAFNFMRDICEMRMQQPNDQMAFPNLKGPWKIRNPWYNAQSPVNNREYISVGFDTDVCGWCDPTETPESLQAMIDEPPKTGKYKLWWDKGNQCWRHNTFYQEKPDLPTVSYDNETGQTPQLEA